MWLHWSLDVDGEEESNGEDAMPAPALCCTSAISSAHSVLGACENVNKITEPAVRNILNLKCGFVGFGKAGTAQMHANPEQQVPESYNTNSPFLAQAASESARAA